MSIIAQWKENNPPEAPVGREVKWGRERGPVGAARGRHSQSGRKNQQDLQMDLIWNVVGREAEN